MLTIHTPIGLTVNPSILTINDNFTQRLTGNYQMIGSGLEPEDMLHFVSQPPEVYLTEGGMTALIDNKTIYENQNLKLDVINNVLNRILVADTYEMTYQDQVFIESVLKKMGVTDVQAFIRQVQNIRQESKNVSYLTDLYWSEKEVVSSLLEYRQMQAEQGIKPEKDEEEQQPENVLWLHQQIMNRLQTGALYQELRNYISTSSDHHQVISRSEMQIAEQTVTAQNILLNKLRNYTMMEEQPLVYHYINAYEMGDEINTYENSRQTMSQMVQAVLLNAIHQMYALRVDELMRQDNVWYQLAGTVYQAAENTFRRFETYHNQNFLTGRDADVYSKNVQQYQKNEIQAIRQLLEEKQYSTAHYTEAGVMPEQRLTYLQPEAEEAEPEELFIGQQPGQTVQNIQKTELHGQQIQSLTTQETLLKNQLEQINQNNIHNQQLLQQLNIQMGETAEPLRINRSKAREDALRMISEPEAVLMNYLESETRVEQQETIQKQQLTQIFGEETIRIFETLEKYQKSPQYTGVTGLPGQGEARLMQDILLHEQELQTQLVHRTQELTRETIHEVENNQLLREYLPENIRQTRQEMQRRIERVEMVYKQEENVLEEEMLEEIRGLHQTTRVQKEQVSEQIVEKNISHEVINTRINELQTRQNEELVQMITDKMQRQLGSISEQVYGKLEKRMDTERRRRGL